MTSIWISPEMFDRLAGSLLHFVWQGAAIALAAAVVLRLLRRGSAQLRYMVASTALFAMLIAPFITFAFHAETGALTLHVLRALNAVSTAAAETSPGNIEIWTQRIVLVWMIGVAVFLVRLAGGWLLSRRMLRAAAAVVAPAVRETLDRARAGMNFNGKVRLLTGNHVETPIVIGWLRPAILLPASALTGLDSDYLFAILAHELAHIRRHDYLVNGMQRAVECVLFYHPAVWWISGRMRVERELCCDDLAIRACGDRLIYAKALVALEKARSAAPILGLPAVDGGVPKRVRRILGIRGANRDWQSAVAALIFVAILVGAGMWQPPTMAVPAVTPIALVPPPAVQPSPVLPAQSSVSLPVVPLNALIAIATAEGVRPPEPAIQVTQPPITPSREAAREKLGLLRVDYSADSFVKQAAEGDTIAVKTFLAAGMEIDSRDRDGLTALIKAAQMRKTETVQSLLAAGANPNLGVSTTDSTKQGSALQFAARNGDLPTMKVLLSGGASVDLKAGSETPLILAVRGGHRDAVHLLLENSASIEGRSEGGPTAFLAAVCTGRFDVARILLDRGADIHAKTSQAAAVQCAAQAHDPEFIKVLLDKGADINAPGQNGAPLLSALSASAPDQSRVSATALLLISRGSDVRGTTNEYNKRTAVHLAAQRGLSDVVRALLAAGANPNATDSFGRGPLSVVIGDPSWRGGIEIVSLLVDGGANVNALEPGPSVSGRLPAFGEQPSVDRSQMTTPLLLAIQARRADIVRVLLAKGADPYKPSGVGVTPLAAASASGSPEIVQLVTEAHAKQ